LEQSPSESGKFLKYQFKLIDQTAAVPSAEASMTATKELTADTTALYKKRGSLKTSDPVFDQLTEEINLKEKRLGAYLKTCHQGTTFFVISGHGIPTFYFDI
jgi:hypothetical protein